MNDDKRAVIMWIIVLVGASLLICILTFGGIELINQILEAVLR